MMTKDKIEFEGKQYDAVEITWMDDSHKQQSMVFATDELYDDLFADRDSDVFKSKDAERLFEWIEYFTSDAHNAETERDFIEALCEENRDYEEIFDNNVVRRCSVCGKPMVNGYMDDWSDWHACSDECRDKYYAEHGGVEAMEDDMEHDACFYTEWDSVFYND